MFTGTREVSPHRFHGSLRVYGVPGGRPPARPLDARGGSVCGDPSVAPAGSPRRVLGLPRPRRHPEQRRRGEQREPYSTAIDNGLRTGEGPSSWSMTSRLSPADVSIHLRPSVRRLDRSRPQPSVRVFQLHAATVSPRARARGSRPSYSDFELTTVGCRAPRGCSRIPVRDLEKRAHPSGRRARRPRWRHSSRMAQCPPSAARLSAAAAWVMPRRRRL